MAESEKDRIAQQTADLRVTFDMALSNKRKYPVAEFKAFVESVRRYIELTAGDRMIHKSVAREDKLKVDIICPSVQAYVVRHPEYSDLVMH